MIRKLYHWTLEQSRSAHAERALFWVAFVESSFFPIPPDVLLIAMVLAHREKWIRYFLICLLGSVLGGCAGYLIGMGVWESVKPLFLDRVFSTAAFNKVTKLYADYDFWVVFTAAFTPIPYKVFTIAGGVAHIDFFRFAAASVIGRAGRFFLVAALLHFLGEKVKGVIEKHLEWLTVVFTVLLIGGFVLLKKLSH